MNTIEQKIFRLLKIAEDIVSQNIQSQQEENERSQSESGEYNAQGQANLLAYMGYSAGFDTYQSMNIPDSSSWYEPRTIYASVVLDDNVMWINKEDAQFAENVGHTLGYGVVIQRYPIGTRELTIGTVDQDKGTPQGYFTYSQFKALQTYFRVN